MLEFVLFDLDGTLLPMDQDVFTKAYFKGLASKVAHLGYDPKELVSAIWKSTGAMTENDGTHTNEEVFWKSFCGTYGEKALNDKAEFDSFYYNEFQKVKDCCGFCSQSKEVVDYIKSKGLRTAVATNPVFPLYAMQSRVRWAGLEAEDFEFITSYETSHYCKPNPSFYTELAKRLGVEPENCLMVGNDPVEDVAAAKANMKVFVLTGNAIGQDTESVTNYPKGNFDELIKYIDSLI
ncbi:MAG: HAD family hydrolase [Ruminococcus sp.]